MADVKDFKDWKYYLEKKECNDKKAKYYINFTYPTKLKVSTESESIYNKLLNGEEHEINTKLNSAIETKYKSKLIDSFNTKFRLFIFKKFLCSNNDFDTYFEESNFEHIGKEFNNFNIDEQLANVFSSQYYQQDNDDKVTYGSNVKTVKEITEKLFDYDCNGSRQYNKCYVFDMTNDNYRTNVKKEITSLYDTLKMKYLENHKDNFPVKHFEELIKKTNCEYCGISIEQINELGKKQQLHNKRSETRGYTLEIDRKFANLEYTESNCCMSCYWCNNAKTDEYIPEEFKPIARGINQVWNQRLKKAGINETVCFPENSKIWEESSEVEVIICPKNE